jgi:hypothetical protein
VEQARGKGVAVVVQTPILVEATRAEVQATVKAAEVAGVPTVLEVAGEVEEVMIEEVEEDVEVDAEAFPTKPRAPMGLLTPSQLQLLPLLVNLEGSDIDLEGR